MELVPGNVAVVTGGASGIGFALASRFAQAGMRLVLADVQDDALSKAVDAITETGVDAIGVHTDVSVEADAQALAAAAVDRFGAVHLVCNNAGVVSKADPWFGPTSGWQWVLGVNLWGVIHGVRAFLPHLLGGGHIVNTASIAGLFPGFTPPYDATKHAVVALSEDLYHDLQAAGVPVGVSVLCPGWVRTSIVDADRNWPDNLGALPEPGNIGAVEHHFRRAIDEGATPASIADAVADAVVANRFWVIPHADFLEIAVKRWHGIAEGLEPEPIEELPNMPPRSQLIAEMMEAMAAAND
jgi:NAD(P)-dependent dehydrogenase (short-subunit alcohol dehydrogenase family)